MSDKAKAALEALEALAKEGRTGWEALAQAIAESEQEEEILAFLQEIVEGEI